MKRSKLSLSVGILLLAVALAGCSTSTTTSSLKIDMVSHAELAAACPPGSDGIFEPRRVRLSDLQKSEYERLTGESVRDVVFFYNITFRRNTAAGPREGQVGEVYIVDGAADAGPFSYFIFVSDGVARKVTLRHPGSIPRWSQLRGMLQKLEGATLQTIVSRPKSPLGKQLRRTLALHAVLLPTPHYIASPVRPV